jgi:hypothetical protein
LPEKRRAPRSAARGSLLRPSTHALILGFGACRVGEQIRGRKSP